MRKKLLSLAGCFTMIISVAFAQDEAPAKNYDNRWFITLPFKFQVQEFGMLEKNRKNLVSDAERLKIDERTNLSFAASVYKNFSTRMSMSMDVGLAKGHVTSKDVLISATKSKTYNIVNATLFYHLLNSSYRVQPFVSLGISNLINDKVYTTAPLGAGAKFTGKKIVVEAHASYGYSVSANVANTMVYNLGIYVPVKGKKAKKKEQEQEVTEKKDSSGKNSVANMTNSTNDHHSLVASGDSSNNKNKDGNGGKEVTVAKDKVRSESSLGGTTDGSNKPGTTPAVPLDPDDPMNLPSAVKSIVYFYYDQYSLTSSAFNIIDKVITRMNQDKTLNVHLRSYADLVGSDQYNLPLSKKRAQMVFDYMNSRGIPAERMVLSHYGKENPVINSIDPKSAWQNRRCELILFKKK